MNIQILIDQYLDLTEQLSAAISGNVSENTVRDIDRKLTKIDADIKCYVPRAMPEYRLQINFFLDRVECSELSSGTSTDVRIVRGLLDNLVNHMETCEQNLAS